MAFAPLSPELKQRALSIASSYKNGGSVKTPLKKAANVLEQQGRKGDTELVHVTPGELSLLETIGSGTTNPVTGLREFFSGDQQNKDVEGRDSSLGGSAGDFEGVDFGGDDDRPGDAEGRDSSLGGSAGDFEGVDFGGDTPPDDEDPRDDGDDPKDDDDDQRVDSETVLDGDTPTAAESILASRGISLPDSPEAERIRAETAATLGVLDRLKETIPEAIEKNKKVTDVPTKQIDFTTPSREAIAAAAGVSPETIVGSGKRGQNAVMSKDGPVMSGRSVQQEAAAQGTTVKDIQDRISGAAQTLEEAQARNALSGATDITSGQQTGVRSIATSIPASQMEQVIASNMGPGARGSYSTRPGLTPGTSVMSIGGVDYTFDNTVPADQRTYTQATPAQVADQQLRTAFQAPTDGIGAVLTEGYDMAGRPATLPDIYDDDVDQGAADVGALAKELGIDVKDVDFRERGLADLLKPGGIIKEIGGLFTGKGALKEAAAGGQVVKNEKGETVGVVSYDEDGRVNRVTPVGIKESFDPALRDAYREFYANQPEERDSDSDEPILPEDVAVEEVEEAPRLPPTIDIVPFRPEDFYYFNPQRRYPYGVPSLMNVRTR